MSETIVQQIRNHLSTLPQHVKQRRTATLLGLSLSAIEDLTSALRELADFCGPPLNHRVEPSFRDALAAAYELLREHESQQEDRHE